MTDRPDFDPDWPHGHQTRDGRKARILTKDLLSSDYPLAVAITSSLNTGYEKLERYTLDGRYSYGHSEHAPFTLVNAPEPKKQFQAWANVYLERENKIVVTYSYPTRELADKNAAKSRIACVFLDFKEGDGL